MESSQVDHSTMEYYNSGKRENILKRCAFLAAKKTAPAGSVLGVETDDFERENVEGKC